jgi:hypothetical protein
MLEKPTNTVDRFIPNDTIADIQHLVRIFTPVIILFIGVFGLFSQKITDEQADRLIFAGSLATGLGVKK